MRHGNRRQQYCVILLALISSQQPVSAPEMVRRSADASACSSHAAPHTLHYDSAIALTGVRPFCASPVFTRYRLCLTGLARSRRAAAGAAGGGRLHVSASGRGHHPAAAPAAIRPRTAAEPAISGRRPPIGQRGQKRSIECSTQYTEGGWRQCIEILQSALLLYNSIL